MAPTDLGISKELHSPLYEARTFILFPEAFILTLGRGIIKKSAMLSIGEEARF